MSFKLAKLVGILLASVNLTIGIPITTSTTEIEIYDFGSYEDQHYLSFPIDEIVIVNEEVGDGLDAKADVGKDAEEIIKAAEDPHFLSSIVSDSLGIVLTFLVPVLFMGLFLAGMHKERQSRLRRLAALNQEEGYEMY